MWERGEKNTRRGIQSQTTYYKVAFRRGSASSRRVEPSFIAVNLNHDPSESPARNSFQIVFLFHNPSGLNLSQSFLKMALKTQMLIRVPLIFPQHTHNITPKFIYS